MTQPSTSDNRLSNASSEEDQHIKGHAEQSIASANSYQPAIVHPNFDPSRSPLDPARPLTDIPEPARRLNNQLRSLYGNADRFYQPNSDNPSKWAVMASEALAEQLSLLSAAKLIELPESFYHNHSEQPLLSALTDMKLLDLVDIQQALQAYPKLTRFGFLAVDDTHTDNTPKKSLAAESLRTLTRRYNPDELLSSVYADDWQVILQPQEFDTGAGSLATDIMACSVAVYTLKQCSTRKSINLSYSAAQICQHVRSYLLSQTVFEPAQRHMYRQVRIFTGHIIVAAYHLGWNMQVNSSGESYFNISSRCGLLTRYANMQDYNINGWSS